MGSELTSQKVIEQIFSSTFICGGSKTGKTNNAMNIARTLMGGNVILFIIDPTKVWVENFHLIKNKVSIKRAELPSIDWNAHHIFDTSKLDAEDQRNFIEQFCRALMRAAVPKKSLKRMVIIEECHTPIPLMSTRSKQKANTLRLLTQGRHFRIQHMAITQFPTTCDDILIKLAEHRYFFRLDQNADIKCAEKYIGKYATQLRSLKKVGVCFYNYRNETVRIETPEFMKALPPLPPRKALKQEEEIKREYPKLMRCIRESPIKLEVNKRKHSKFKGQSYIFHIFPFGELGSMMEHTLINEIVRGMHKLISEFEGSYDYILGFGTGDKWACFLAPELKTTIHRIPERKTDLPGEVHLHLDTFLYEKNLYFRDFKAGDKVILIDDVISTAETSKAFIETLGKMGVKVVAFLCIVAKGNDFKRVEELGVPVRYLFHMV